MPATRTWLSAVRSPPPIGLGMAEGDHAADAGAQVGGGLAGQHQSAAQAARGQPRRPGGPGRQHLGGHVHRTAVAAHRAGHQQSGLHRPGLGQGAHLGHHRPGRRVVGVQRHGDPGGRGAQQPGRGGVQGGAEGVEQADDRDQGGDRRGDAEQGEGGPPRRAQHIAQRDLAVAAAGQPEPPQQRGEPVAAGGQMADPDRLHRLDPDRPPDRPGGRGERQHEPDHGGLGERAVLERGAPHRQRQQVLEYPGQRDADQVADPGAEQHADQRDLRGEQQRADRQQPGAHAERHPDADLAALRLHDPGGQVQRGERRPGQQQDRDRAPQLRVALDVVIQDPVGGDVGPGGDGRADRRAHRGQGGLQLALDRGQAAARLHGEDQVVDPAGSASQLLGGAQRGEQHRVGLLAEEHRGPARPAAHEVLRGLADPGVTDPGAARRPQHPAVWQAVLPGEPPVQDDRGQVAGGSGARRRGQALAGGHLDGVHGRPRP